MFQSSCGKPSLWRQDLQDLRDLARCAAAEFLGTTILVWIACATCAQFTDNGGTLQTALTVAFIVSTLVQSLAHVSGCHINPAVTVAFCLLGKVSWLRALVYTNCQYVAGVVGAAIYKVTTPESLQGVGMCATDIDEAAGVSWWQGLIVEAVLTGVLVLVILAVTQRPKPIPGFSGPLVIGLAVAADFLMGLQYSGASLNPARSLGPAVLSGYFNYHLIYWGGPITGAVVATLTWKYVLEFSKPADL